MSWWRKLFGLGPTKLESALHDALNARDAAIDQMRTELDALKAASVKVDPNITIRSTGIGPAGDVKLELEWNDEFIEELRANGYHGTDEEEMVNQWLNALMARYTRPDIMDNGLDLLDKPPTSYDPQLDFFKGPHDTL